MLAAARAGQALSADDWRRLAFYSWETDEQAVLAREVFVAYCHPYEFDPDEFAHLGHPLPLKTRLHQGLGRRGFERKFRQMLREFETTLAGLVAEKAMAEAPVHGR